MGADAPASELEKCWLRRGEVNLILTTTIFSRSLFLDERVFSTSRIKVTVISVTEPCSGGLKVGDTFYVNNDPCLRLQGAGGVCLELVHAIIPAAMTMAYGGKFPWEEDGRMTIACPDAKSRVVVTLERES